jgi:uncharacterized protein (TIGR03067 family)
MLLRSIAVLVVSLAFAIVVWGGDVKSKNVMNANDNLDGTWQVSAAELGGKKWPEELCKMTRLILDGQNYTVMVGDAPDKGTIKVDSSAKPKSIDVTGTEGPNKGKTFPAIYELGKDKDGGDTLRICYDLSGQSRPTEFKSTEGTKLFLVTYTRAKS